MNYGAPPSPDLVAHYILNHTITSKLVPIELKGRIVILKVVSATGIAGTLSLLHANNCDLLHSTWKYGPVLKVLYSFYEHSPLYRL